MVLVIGLLAAVFSDSGTRERTARGDADRGDETSGVEELELPPALLEPGQLWFHRAGEASPIRSGIPPYDYASWTGESGRVSGGARIWSQMGLLGENDSFGGRQLVLAFITGAHELQQWSFAHHEEAIIAVLVAEHTFEVQVIVEEEVTQSWSFDNHQPWVTPVTHVALVGNYVALQGTLDHRPWHAGPVLRVYDVESGDLLARRDVFQEPPPLPRWSWSETSPNTVVHCSSHDAESGECVGARTVGSVVNSALTITRSWPGTQRSASCGVPLYLNTDVRLDVQPNYVHVLSRSESDLTVSQYDAHCQLVARRSVPVHALDTDRPPFAELPLVPHLLASRSGVYFETESTCGSNCGLRVFQLIGGSSTGHNMVEPVSVATGYSDDYVWWAYWNHDDWYVYVLDRETHEMLFAEMGPHRELSNPITGLKVEDGRVSIQIGSSFGMGRMPSYETRVYDIETDELLVSVTNDSP